MASTLWLWMLLQVYNFSTGRLIHKQVLDNEVTAMDHDHTGQLLFCGDAQVVLLAHKLLLQFLESYLCRFHEYSSAGWCLQGCIYTVGMNSRTGALSRFHRNRNGSKRKSPVTVVQYRTFSLLARGPVLLTCTQDGSLAFFRFEWQFRSILLRICFYWACGDFCGCGHDNDSSAVLPWRQKAIWHFVALSNWLQECIESELLSARCYLLRKEST